MVWPSPRSCFRSQRWRRSSRSSPRTRSPPLHWGLFSSSWLALGLSLITSAPGARAIRLLIAFAAPVISLAVAGMAGKPLIGLLLLLSATRSILDGIFQLSGTISVEHAAGYVAGAIAVVAWYGGTALLVEDVDQRTLPPVFRRGGGPRCDRG